MDDEQRYRIVQSKDPRFDGWFVTAVTSTGIYCRPSCPAMTPRRTNARFYPTAAAAQTGGFRACKRCRPDASAGSPEWNVRADIVARAMRLIADGVVEREGVTGLAATLGYSERQLHRHLVAELGTGALALARAQRTQTARVLLETTALPVTEVAFAAGFASVRQFNDTIRAVFAQTPRELRARHRARRRADATPTTAGAMVLRLPYRAPMHLGSAMRFLAARTVGGIEEYADGVYRRTLRLPYGVAVVAVSAPRDASATYLHCALELSDVRDLGAAVTRCRRLLDLDADPVAVDADLSTDPLLEPFVRAAPGLRSPGHVDGTELAVRAVLGQQVSVAAARTTAQRLVVRFGKPLGNATGTLTHVFPDPDVLAGADDADLPMPATRRRALIAMCEALADGRLHLDPGADRDDAVRALLALPGVGPWTASYIRMRALGDPDAFLPTDLGLRHALDRLGVPSAPKAASEGAERWRPWRAYALHHLWSSLSTAPSPQPDDNDSDARSRSPR